MMRATARTTAMTRHSAAAAIEGGALPLPDDCAVRLIDLDPGVGGLIAVDEEGFVNIYLNARLSQDAQRRALQHELRHYYRGDLFSDADIREVERAVDAPPPGEAPKRRVLRAIDGSRLRDPAPVFAPDGLRRVGRGLYLPTGENRDRAERDLGAVEALVDEACRVYDVMQTPPRLSAARLREAARGLGAGDIAFIAWRPEAAGGSADAPRLPVVMHFCRETEAHGVRGAVYYAADGRVDNALAALRLDGFRITVDLRNRGGALAVWGIFREIDGRRYERIY